MRKRVRVEIRGAVQGVGFRPFVYRLAGELGLAGWVANSPQGVSVELEGEESLLDQALQRLDHDRPPHAAIHGLESRWLDAVPSLGFEIRSSAVEGKPLTVVLPDIATCDACRAEIFDPGNRRFRYPFTNCTNCGPRFTIIEQLPYDRPNTSMRTFQMCAACRREYDDPRDRRFHAQPNACPSCGPQLSLRDLGNQSIAVRDRALTTAVGALRAGMIVAVKGIGGFHLMVDATNDRAVARLRRLKGREEKPLAVMYPTLADVEEDASVTEPERRLLVSAEAPIVLVRRRTTSSRLSDDIAPGNPNLGVMLPYAPLHHLLLADFRRPLVATSGNLSEEPICTDEREAIVRLKSIADYFLVHDRPIVRHADDSVVRVVLGRELVLRRARGYAPLPIRLRTPVTPTIAVGGHMKNTVAVSAGENVFISQHIGDLDSPQSMQAFKAVLASVRNLYRTQPALVVADLHPEYTSTKHARTLGLPVVQVQHHVAHVASCVAENELQGPVLGVAWDGTGYGTDGTVWGGEFLVVDGGTFARAGCLRPFRLPGGEQAVREPRRSALGLLYALDGGTLAASVMADAFAAEELRVLLHAIDRGVNAPITTSAGRLFDAVAAIAGIRYRTSFEGQAALQLECAIADGEHQPYPFAIKTNPERFGFHGHWTPPPFVIDWGPMIRAIVGEMRAGAHKGAVAARFHATLAAMIAVMARRIGQQRVVLSGGCFQNAALTEAVVTQLRHAGFQPYWHQRVPPNDGGISLGQLAIVHERSNATCASQSPAKSSQSRATTSCAPAESTLPVSSNA
jgi:hydrogenase maturation protein HypF